MSQPIVFFDIAGQDDAKLRDFYASNFGWKSDKSGQFSIDVARFEVPGVVVLGLFRDPAGNPYSDSGNR